MSRMKDVKAAVRKDDTYPCRTQCRRIRLDVFVRYEHDRPLPP